MSSYDFELMKGWTGEDFVKAIRILEAMPVEKPKPLIKDPVETCVCGKSVPVASLEELDTGVFKCLNDVCKGCVEGHKIDKKMARLVCCNCKRVIVRIKPATDKTGFKFIAGKTYHTPTCALCTEGTVRCPIIEKVMWNKKHGIK